jgi:hypothetical protein
MLPPDDRPVKIEQEVPKEEPKLDPAAQAAQNLPGMLAWFKYIVNDKLGGVHAKRVLVALSEVPFNTEEPHFTTDDQHDAYLLGQQITNAKFLLLMASLREANNKQTAQKTEEKEKENDQEA